MVKIAPVGACAIADGARYHAIAIPAAVNQESSVRFRIDDVLGDPTGANAEFGRRLVELQVQATVNAIRTFLGQPGEPHD